MRSHLSAKLFPIPLTFQQHFWWSFLIFSALIPFCHEAFHLTSCHIPYGWWLTIFRAVMLVGSAMAVAIYVDYVLSQSDNRLMWPVWQIHSFFSMIPKRHLKLWIPNTIDPGFMRSHLSAKLFPTPLPARNISNGYFSYSQRSYLIMRLSI